MKVYNTLTRKKEEFIPVEEGKVKYVRSYRIQLFSYRKCQTFRGVRYHEKAFGVSRYKVKFVQNFTDVDDKIISRAREEGVSAADRREKYIEEYR